MPDASPPKRQKRRSKSRKRKTKRSASSTAATSQSTGRGHERLNSRSSSVRKPPTAPLPLTTLDPKVLLPQGELGTAVEPQPSPRLPPSSALCKPRRPKSTSVVKRLRGLPDATPCISNESPPARLPRKPAQNHTTVRSKTPTLPSCTGTALKPTLEASPGRIDKHDDSSEDPSPSESPVFLSPAASRERPLRRSASCTIPSTVKVVQVDQVALAGALTPQVRSKRKTSAGFTVAPPLRQRKFIVEANAYHCSCVTAAISNRGPEWKIVNRMKPRLKAADIEECDFVWFKYEHIDSIPKVTMQSHLLDDTILAIPTVLETYNARVVPFQPESTSPSPDLLANLDQQRVPMSTYRTLRQRASPPTAKSEAAYKPLHYQTLAAAKNSRVVSCFELSSAVWRKHRLYHCLKTWCDANPSSRGSIRERMPISMPFNLWNNTEEEAVNFMKGVTAAQNVKRWLAKATGGANGAGIFVSEDPEAVAKYVAQQPKRGSEPCEQDWWIIQEFLERVPLLCDRRRFQVKLHCLTLATPVGYDVYVHRGQRIQVCQEAFDVEKKASFVGNWAQQREVDSLKHEEYIYTLEALAKDHPQLIPCWHRMHTIVAESVEAAHLHDAECFRSTPGCFDIMGWDFLVEEREDGVWQPLLLEANHRPGYGCSRSYIEAVVNDAISLALQPVVANRKVKGTSVAKITEVERPWVHARTIMFHPAATMDGGIAQAPTQSIRSEAAASTPQPEGGKALVAEDVSGGSSSWSLIRGSAEASPGHLTDSDGPGTPGSRHRATHAAAAEEDYAAFVSYGKTLGEF